MAMTLEHVRALLRGASDGRLPLPTAQDCARLANALTQPAQAVDVPDGCVLVAIERGEGYEDVHPDLVAEDCMHSATEHGWRYQVIPTSPTDKDQR